MKTTTLVLLGLLLLVGPARANEPDDAVPVARHVLALVDSAGQGWELDVEDSVHVMAEMPLNHLGMIVRRHDIRQGPPPDAWLTDLRAVITCFDDTGTPPAWLWPWLEARARTPGLRFVHLASFGPLGNDDEGEEDYARLKAWLSRFGLGLDDYYLKDPIAIRTEYRDPALCAFEDDPRYGVVHHGPWSERESNTVWVTTTCEGDAHRTRNPVVTGPWGGVAISPWLWNRGTGDGDRRWHVDPFAFFTEALGLERVPAPQPSVLNGRRMFFCHVDGDGFESHATFRGAPYNGKVLLDQIVDAYPLPFTVSIIVASLTDDIGVAEPTERMKIAAEIFRRDNVEPGTHTVLHPFFWHDPPENMLGHETRAYESLEGYEFSPVAEVRESIRFIDERLTTPPKRCRMVLWSGDAIPTDRALKESERLDNLNINGLIHRSDDSAESIGYVPPMGRIVGEYVQVYPGAPNENVYPGFFTTLPAAFRHVDQTIERLGEGRILKPANVYIHFYSVERPPRLTALKRLLDRWGIEEHLAPVFASTYAAAVRTALTTAEILRTGDGWEFRGFDHCRSVRIDGEPRHPDFRKSRGILGAKRKGDSLYLHLSAPEARVVLRDEPVPFPHIEEANHALSDVALSESGLSFLSTSLGQREVLIAGFLPNAELDVQLGEEAVSRRADEDGRLLLTIGGPGESRVEVHAR